MSGALLGAPFHAISLFKGTTRNHKGPRLIILICVTFASHLDLFEDLMPRKRSYMVAMSAG